MADLIQILQEHRNGLMVIGALCTVWFFMGALATFVATTEICVPSIMFTLMFGVDRAACPSIAAALSRGSSRG